MTDSRADILADANARQREAADPNHSAWVSANAGTGKTRVLTDRIARLLLRRVRPEKILCLTYTKAAAAEMKNRITGRLGEWAGMDDTALRQDISRLIGGDPSADDLILARRLFAATLDAPGGGVNISTIHAFCQSLLARFPVEANIAPHAGVMDDREAGEVQREAQHRVFRDIDRGGANAERLSDALRYLAGYLQPEDFTDLVKTLLGAGRKFQRALIAHQGRGGLTTAVYTALDLTPGETEDAIVTAACNDGVFEVAGLQEAADVFSGGNPTEQKHAPKIRAWLDAPTHQRAGSLWEDYCSVFLTREGGPRADRSLIAKKTMEARPDIDRAIHTEQDRIVAVAERCRAARTAAGTAHLIALGAALNDAYENIKRERALLDYDDLIHKALALLENEQAVSWVHYKLDGGIDHILVDEAQDTSPPQWDIIRSLSLEMFSGMGTREDEGFGVQAPGAPPARTVFAVGDEKQSIYSFQGADPAGFAEARDWFRVRAEAAAKELRKVDLIQSFRTTKPVLDAVDQVFVREPARTGVVEGTAELRHLPSRHHDAGAIELWPAIERTEPTHKNPWAPLDDVREESPLARTAERVAGTIRRWLDDGEMLPSLGRPINEGDIMILVERRTQFAEEMVKRLKHLRIEVAGSDRMMLAEQMAVMDLMAAARIALLIDDDLTLATVLKGPFVGLGEEYLYTLAHGRSGRLWPRLQSLAEEEPAGPWCVALAAVAAIRARADHMPPFEFFASLLGEARGRRRLYTRLGAEAGDPIDEFLGLALLFERTHPPSLQGFLHWIESGANEIKRDMEVVHRAVRVMTVHGAKGLEAPVVILPDTCGDNTRKKAPAILWLNPEDGSPALPIWPGVKRNDTMNIRALRDAVNAGNEAENHRLLYVAMTRARDRLHVTGWERSRKAKDAEHGRKPGSWYELIRPALEGMPDVEPFEAPGGEGARVTSPQQAPSKTDDVGVTSDTLALAAEPWMASPPLDEAEPSNPLTPSRPVEDNPAALSPFTGDDLTRFRRGRLIHRLLQTLPDLDPTGWEQATATWLGVSAPDLNDATRDAIRDETLAVVRDPAFSDLFAPGSLAEVPIAGLIDIAGRQRTITGQIDRLVVTPERVMIVDYKTNRPPPADEAGVAPAYIRQMAAYRAVLRAIYPDREIVCVLLWTDGPYAMTLSDAAFDNDTP